MSDILLPLFLVVLLVAGIFGTATILANSIEAEQPLKWHYQACATLDGVEQVLNSLPLERALEAKIVVINSQRALMGALSSPYYVYYRR